MSKSLNSKSWDPTFLITEEKSITMSLTKLQEAFKGMKNSLASFTMKAALCYIPNFS